MTKQPWQIERDQRNAEIDAALSDWSMKCTHIPDLSPDFKDLRLKYHVQFFHKGRLVLQTPYSMGVAHIPNYDAMVKKFGSNTRDYVEWLRHCCGHGKVTRYLPSFGLSTMQGEAILPELRDVMHCLVMDSDVLNYRSFKEWAHELGFDTVPVDMLGRPIGSVIDAYEQARKAYDACMESALALRMEVHDEGMAALQELFQDY